jgi:hypothetical protein
MDGWLAWLLAAVGLALLAATFLSVLWTLVVPRSTPSRLAESVIASVRWCFRLVARALPSYRGCDRLLAMLPPVALLSVLLVWLALLAVGFALVAAPVTGLTPTEAIADMAAAVLGLDYVDTPDALRVVTLLAVLTGVIVVALLIGYLPTLYGAFNQREQLVSLLDSRAGSPAWGVEVLARAARDDAMEDLDGLFGMWEQWAADIGESHSSYPILSDFRSQEPDQSWILAALAMLDAAALDQALRPTASPLSGRLLLRTGYMALRSIAATAGIEVDHDPHPDDPIALTPKDLAGAVTRLRKAGYEPERSVEEAWPHVRGWRVNYEAAAYALAARIIAPPAPWSGARLHGEDRSSLPKRPVDRKPPV